MFNNLTALGYALVAFGIIVIVGSVVMMKLGDSIATCASTHTYNSSSRLCTNSTGGDTSTPANTAYTSSNYMVTQLGSTSGLASWTPAIIALAIGLLFLGAFLARKGKQY